MKKKSVVIPLVGLVLLLAAWYFWPRSLWSPLSGLDREDIAACDAVLIPGDPASGLSTRYVTVDPESPEFEQLLDLLTSTRYVRSPVDLVSGGRTPSTVVITLKPYSADLFFHRTDGTSCSVRLYGPDLSLNDKTYFPLGGSALQQKAVDLLASWPDMVGP